jgi:hypothetical protein
LNKHHFRNITDSDWDLFDAFLERSNRWQKKTLWIFNGLSAEHRPRFLRVLVRAPGKHDGVAQREVGEMPESVISFCSALVNGASRHRTRPPE